jgi:phenylalanyl-tRNA synthetase beta chain
LPDRAHDCLSHWGIAKEISAIFGLKIKGNEHGLQGRFLKEPFQEPSLITKEISLDIEIQNNKCIRYMGRIIRNIKVVESPDWLKERLKSIGQKPINNIVDVANFVMYDIGQPIHCFDLDKLSSNKISNEIGLRQKIIIRNAKKDEKITTLDRREIDLDESVLVIADESHPLAIAGIKGGNKAEVDNNTKNIIIEVANFDALSIRKTSKKVGIFTDAVKRYENGITPELCGKAMNEVSELIFSLTEGEMENIIDIYTKKEEKRIVNVSTQYINRRLGSHFNKEEIKSVWEKLGFEYTIISDHPVSKEEEKGVDFEIKVPFLRMDIVGPHDLVEEVGRILGYDRLEEKLPKVIKRKINSKTFIEDSSWMKMSLAKHKLLESGYSEVMTYVFRDRGEVEVLASVSGKNFLRDNLSDGLKESIKFNQLNLPLLDVNEVKVFEVGTIFKDEKEEIHVAYGDKKSIVEVSLDEYLETISPEYSSDFFVQIMGSYLSLAESEEGSLVSPVSSRPLELFKSWSMYPFITRDIAVWIPEGVAPEKLVEIYKSFGTELLIKEPKLFDSFTKPSTSSGEKGKTSFAYRLVFQSKERTLIDEEINQIMSKITEKIISLGWQVR